MNVRIIEPGEHYDADLDLTPMSIGHDIRSVRLLLNDTASVAFCPCDSPDRIIYAEGATEELAHLLGEHGFKVAEPL